MGTGANFAIATRRANCVERMFAALSAASNSCVTALAAFRKLKHAQYSVPCRLGGLLEDSFEVYMHIIRQTIPPRIEYVTLRDETLATPLSELEVSNG